MYAEDFIKITQENTNFRTVLHTGDHSQMVAMNIAVGGDIGEETHDGTDQMLLIVSGDCEATIDGVTRKVEKNAVVFVHAGEKHNFRNVGNSDLKIFTIYAPAEHEDGTVHKTKADAEKDEK